MIQDGSKESTYVDKPSTQSAQLNQANKQTIKQRWINIVIHDIRMNG